MVHSKGICARKGIGSIGSRRARASGGLVGVPAGCWNKGHKTRRAVDPSKKDHEVSKGHQAPEFENSPLASFSVVDAAFRSRRLPWGVV